MSLPKPYYEDEARGIVIYNADCREILPHLPKVDLLLTDPPYGIDWKGHNGSDRDWSNGIANDSGDLDLGFLFDVDAEHKVVFGANCFPATLPHRGRWLVWDKRVDPKCDAMLGSPVELAWTSRTSGFDWIVRVQHGGVVNADKGQRAHPTQKPVAVMAFVLGKYPKAETVLDPFMGSGTTLVACKQLGRKCVGIDISEEYCRIAVRRLSQDLLFDSEELAQL